MPDIDEPQTLREVLEQAISPTETASGEGSGCAGSVPSHWTPSDYDKRAQAVNMAVTHLANNAGQLIDTAHEILDFLNGIVTDDTVGA